MGVNVQYNGFVYNALFGPSNLISQDVDLVSNFLEVEELLAWDFFKDTPRFGLIV